MAIMHLLAPAIHAAERGRLPDAVVRFGIRRMLASRLRALHAGGEQARQRRRAEFIEQCRRSPVAALPEKANQQHYEVPAEFYELVLGPHRKYSCCCWPHDAERLEQAEAEALEITCHRAQLQDGQSILELGCGWGSLSLWMAKHYPHSTITAVSNSASQRRFIEDQAQRRNLGNLQIVTADINDFQPPAPVDRVVSVEMFEHVRNHGELLRRIATWLNPGGKLFVHHFAHRTTPYFFEPAGDSDWMAQHFFSGGVMPSHDLLPEYQSDLRSEQRWQWNGEHYARTCDAWLANLDRESARALPILSQTYGDADAALWLQRWRIFFMACSELFAWSGGREWFVSHHLFART